MRLGMVPGFPDWRSVAMVTLSALLAPPGEVLRGPRRGRVLTGPGLGVGRRSLRLFRQGASWGAQTDRCLLVQGRPDARRLRGPRGGAAPLLPRHQQGER